MDKQPHIALLLAGGQGLRMHSPSPKQFMTAGGEPVVAHTMRAFERHPAIEAIYVVCHPDWNEFITAAARQGGITKFAGLFPAGTTSILSLRNGVEGIARLWEGRNPAIITHDSVRPLVAQAVIDRNLDVFHAHGNAIAAVVSQEAYMVSHDGKSSGECIPRELLFRAQTPQTFSLIDLLATFAEADRRGIADSQSLYTLMAKVYPSRPLHISAGDEMNFKLTHPEDLEILEYMLPYFLKKEG